MEYNVAAQKALKKYLFLSMKVVVHKAIHVYGIKILVTISVNTAFYNVELIKETSEYFEYLWIYQIAPNNFTTSLRCGGVSPRRNSIFGVTHHLFGLELHAHFSTCL